MGVYDRQIANAKRQIKVKGQEVTWRQTVDGNAPDVAKPWKPGTAITTDNNVSVLFLPASSANAELLRSLTGSTVPIGSLKGLMAAQSFVPTIKDVVIRGGVPLAIETIDTFAPNGDTILYEIRFKG